MGAGILEVLVDFEARAAMPGIEQRERIKEGALFRALSIYLVNAIASLLDCSGAA